MVIVRNKFDTLQETFVRYTLNNKHENFVIAHLDAADKTKPKIKRRIFCEFTAVM